MTKSFENVLEIALQMPTARVMIATGMRMLRVTTIRRWILVRRLQRKSGDVGEEGWADVAFQGCSRNELGGVARRAGW
jgi:hypothetical protein